VVTLFVRRTEPVKRVLLAKDSAVYMPLDSQVTNVILVRNNFLNDKQSALVILQVQQF